MPPALDAMVSIASASRPGQAGAQTGMPPVATPQLTRIRPAARIARDPAGLQLTRCPSHRSAPQQAHRRSVSHACRVAIGIGIVAAVSSSSILRHCVPAGAVGWYRAQGERRRRANAVRRSPAARAITATTLPARCGRRRPVMHAAANAARPWPGGWLRGPTSRRRAHRPCSPRWPGGGSPRPVGGAGVRLRPRRASCRCARLRHQAPVSDRLRLAAAVPPTVCASLSTARPRGAPPGTRTEGVNAARTALAPRRPAPSAKVARSLGLADSARVRAPQRAVAARQLRDDAIDGALQLGHGISRTRATRGRAPRGGHITPASPPRTPVMGARARRRHVLPVVTQSATARPAAAVGRQNVQARKRSAASANRRSASARGDRLRASRSSAVTQVALLCSATAAPHAALHTCPLRLASKRSPDPPRSVRARKSATAPRTVAAGVATP